jgi:hypothetical protein
MRLLAVLVVAAVAGSVALAAGAGQPRKVIKPTVQARAKAISLHRSDLPGSNWTSSPSAPSRSSTPSCPYYNPDQSDLTENGDVDSPTFHRSDGSDVETSVSIFVSAAQAKTAFDRVVKPAFSRCVADLLRKSAKPGSLTVVSTRTLAFPRFGHKTGAFRISLIVVSGTQKVPVLLDIVGVNKGKVDVAFFFTGVGKGFTPAFERQIVGRVAARI